MLCFSIVLWLRRLGKSAPKNGSSGEAAAQDVAKICTTLWRENGLEVKNLQNWQVRGTFWNSIPVPKYLHHAVQNR